MIVDETSGRFFVAMNYVPNETESKILQLIDFTLLEQPPKPPVFNETITQDERFQLMQALTALMLKDGKVTRQKIAGSMWEFIFLRVWASKYAPLLKNEHGLVFKLAVASRMYAHGDRSLSGTWLLSNTDSAHLLEVILKTSIYLPSLNDENIGHATKNPMLPVEVFEEYVKEALSNGSVVKAGNDGLLAFYTEAMFRNISPHLLTDNVLEMLAEAGIVEVFKLQHVQECLRAKLDPDFTMSQSWFERYLIALYSPQQES